MADYWNALKTLNQVAGELGLPQVTSLVTPGSAQSTQLLAMLNSAGNELTLYYPWEQFHKEWAFPTQSLIGDYTLPADWSYFIDQTLWDRTDHWPLLGPKSAQEWAWLKGGLLAMAPRLRYRISNNKFMIFPVPTATATPLTLSMEYVSKNWVQHATQAGTTETDMIVSDADLLMYNPWLLIKYVKFKFYELKGLPTTGVQGDFMRIFNSLTGKDVGAPILSLSRQQVGQYLGPWSVPDGSWATGGAT